MAERHYAVHAGKHFYAGLIEFITSGPVAAMALEGPDAIATVRRLVGATMPNEAERGNHPRRPGDQRPAQPDPRLRRRGDGGDELACGSARQLLDYEREVDAWIVAEEPPRQ